jgi:hypothetical protein
MTYGKKLEAVLENPNRMKTIKRLFYAILALLVIGDFFIPRAHPHFIWDQIPTFSSLYGFLSCVVIIIVSKFIGHSGGLMVREDYYETSEDHSESHAQSHEGGAKRHD